MERMTHHILSNKAMEVYMTGRRVRSWWMDQVNDVLKEEEIIGERFWLINDGWTGMNGSLL
jgi:hypothetical protein